MKKIGVITISGFIVCLTILEIINVYSDSSQYPFGSEFFPSISIYKSKELYLSYNITLAICTVAMTVCYLRKKKVVFYLLLVLNLLMLAYPFVTTS